MLKLMLKKEQKWDENAQGGGGGGEHFSRAPRDFLKLFKSFFLFGKVFFQNSEESFVPKNFAPLIRANPVDAPGYNQR